MAALFMNTPMVRKQPNNTLCKNIKLKPRKENERSVLLRFKEYMYNADTSLAGKIRTNFIYHINFLEMLQV